MIDSPKISAVRVPESVGILPSSTKMRKKELFCFRETVRSSLFPGFSFRFLFLSLLLIVFTGCMTVPLPLNKPLPDSINLDDLSAFEKEDIPKYKGTVVEKISFPTKNVKMPRAGEKNSYGIRVTPELERAYDAYMGGDGEAALQALKKAEQEQTDKLFLWHVSFFRAQTLIMMGRAADAEEELEKTSRLEIAVTGSNLNARALRGEARVWLGHYKGAKTDFFQVIRAIGSWELPTSYALPPNNISKLVLLTTAQLRAFTGLAIMYMLQEDYASALPWAEKAEKSFNDVHYVSNHPLYGNFISTHADSYYGRAMNLTTLASARFAVTGDLKKSEILFDKALGFFDAVGYTSGKVTVFSLKARVFNRSGHYDKCYPAGREALKLAVKSGMWDFVWRIETLTGETLLEFGLSEEAEKSFRGAQSSVDLISGNLSTDRAKTRFGVGKEDITYYLSKIDADKGDYATLFEDLERGRARSFIDMLADRLVNAGREKELVSLIRELDRKIVRQRLINAAQGLKNPGGIRIEKDMLDRRQKLVTTLRKRDPDMADTLSVWTFKLSEVQGKLESGEVIAYALPMRGNDKLRFLLIKPSSVELKELDITADGLRKKINAFTQEIGLKSPPLSKMGNRGIVLKAKKPSVLYGRGGRSAADTLRTDLAIDALCAEKTLYVVPNGELYFVPWGVLDTRVPVVMLPTGGWLGRTPRDVAFKREVVVVGDPEFGGKLPQLPGAREEAIDVAEQYNVTPLLGKDATEENVRHGVGDGVDALHLATHGIYYPEIPLKSAIFLSSNDGATPVTAIDIFHSPIPAKLVVLSACETGMGRSVAGDDMLGLVRSFYLGGTLTVLSSLWPVDDVGTKEFMKVFHKAAAGGDYGLAWIKARDHLKKRGFPPSVYGAFVLGGVSHGK